jgi:hypothetical protein
MSARSAADARGTPAEIGKPRTLMRCRPHWGGRALLLLAIGIPAAASDGAKLLKLAVKGLR